MPVRLKDVAQHAGVSVKTVSNVVNDHPHVSPTMRARVQASLTELGYRPNLAARQLKHGRGGFITLAVPELDSPYFAELAARLSDEATRRGFLLLLDITGADPAQERLVLSGMRAHMVDGVIFSPLVVTAEEIAARTDDIPLVLLGERRTPTQFDHVAVDSVAASRAMGEHFVDRGCRRLAVIGRQTRVGTASVRLEGFTAAVHDAGLDLPDERVVTVDGFGREEGYRGMQQLLALPPERRPDAVFAFNDLMAVGALRACHEAGVRVPQEVAVGGFDDNTEGRFHTPSLTTVSPDLGALTAAVLDLLVARIHGSTAPPEHPVVPWRLTVRESSNAG
ncbi:LacI family DNA-binding transcriptional regulator [Serinicoccus kebangsaanensis]|uniref:LacI family DNA-binding transcriptional regulator n=1 Tax=Serinicoccus kebangsaanensis TaxID=2602069 RepID=UPI00124DC86B|nr:LacI family DNA-binding transcriptional regulator [Serinicoccus kebangsaanensis]